MNPYPNQKESKMKTITPLGLALAAGALAIAGCAEQPGYQPQSQYPSQQYPGQQYPSPQSQGQYPQQGYQNQAAFTGTVDRIEVINRGDSSNIAGTVIGGVVGGLIGSQIGGGKGTAVATIAGIAGGAYAGNQIERRRTPQDSFRVTIRMDNGSMQTLSEANISDLRTGDRVRVDGNVISRY